MFYFRVLDAKCLPKDVKGKNFHLLKIGINVRTKIIAIESAD